MAPGDLIQLCFTVKRRVVHNHNVARTQKRRQLSLKPEFKNRRIRVPVVIHGRDESVSDSRGDRIRPRVLSSRDFSENFLASRRVSVFPIIIVPKSGFIQINPLFRAYILENLLIRPHFPRVLLFIPPRLFFRVIPSRLNALPIA